MSIYSIKNFYTILQIVKAQILINFDRSLTNLCRKGEKLPKHSKDNVCKRQRKCTNINALGHPFSTSTELVKCQQFQSQITLCV